MVRIEVAFSTPSGVGRGAAAAARNPGRFFAWRRARAQVTSQLVALFSPLQQPTTKHRTAHLPNLSYTYYWAAFLDRHFYHIVLS